MLNKFNKSENLINIRYLKSFLSSILHMSCTCFSQYMLYLIYHQYKLHRNTRRSSYSKQTHTHTHNSSLFLFRALFLCLYRFLVDPEWLQKHNRFKLTIINYKITIILHALPLSVVCVTSQTSHIPVPLLKQQQSLNSIQDERYEITYFYYRQGLGDWR